MIRFSTILFLLSSSFLFANARLGNGWANGPISVESASRLLGTENEEIQSGSLEQHGIESRASAVRVRNDGAIQAARAQVASLDDSMVSNILERMLQLRKAVMRTSGLFNSNSAYAAAVTDRNGSTRVREHSTEALEEIEFYARQLKDLSAEFSRIVDSIVQRTILDSCSGVEGTVCGTGVYRDPLDSELVAAVVKSGPVVEQAIAATSGVLAAIDGGVPLKEAEFFDFGGLLRQVDESLANFVGIFTSFLFPTTTAAPTAGPTSAPARVLAEEAAYAYPGVELETRGESKDDVADAEEVYRLLAALVVGNLEREGFGVAPGSVTVTSEAAQSVDGDVVSGESRDSTSRSPELFFRTYLRLRQGIVDRILPPLPSHAPTSTSSPGPSGSTTAAGSEPTSAAGSEPTSAATTGPGPISSSAPAVTGTSDSDGSTGPIVSTSPVGVTTAGEVATFEPTEEADEFAARFGYDDDYV